MPWYAEFCADYLEKISQQYERFDGRPVREIRDFWGRFFGLKALRHFAGLVPAERRTSFLFAICKVAWTQNIAARSPDPLVWRRKLAREMTPRMVASFGRVIKIVEEAELLFSVPALVMDAAGVPYELAGETAVDFETVIGGVSLPPHTISRGLFVLGRVLGSAKQTRDLRLGKFLHHDPGRSTISDGRASNALTYFADTIEEFTGRPMFTPHKKQGKKEGVPHGYLIRDLVRGVGFPITWHDRDVQRKLTAARKRISITPEMVEWARKRATKGTPRPARDES